MESTPRRGDIDDRRSPKRRKVARRQSPAGAARSAASDRTDKEAAELSTLNETLKAQERVQGRDEKLVDQETESAADGTSVPYVSSTRIESTEASSGSSQSPAASSGSSRSTAASSGSSQSPSGPFNSSTQKSPTTQESGTLGKLEDVVSAEKSRCSTGERNDVASSSASSDSASSFPQPSLLRGRSVSIASSYADAPAPMSDVATAPTPMGDDATAPTPMGDDATAPTSMIDDTTAPAPMTDVAVDVQSEENASILNANTETEKGDTERPHANSADSRSTSTSSSHARPLPRENVDTFERKMSMSPSPARPRVSVIKAESSSGKRTRRTKSGRGRVRRSKRALVSFWLRNFILYECI